MFEHPAGEEEGEIARRGRRQLALRTHGLPQGEQGSVAMVVVVAVVLVVLVVLVLVVVVLLVVVVW